MDEGYFDQGMNDIHHYWLMAKTLCEATHDP